MKEKKDKKVGGSEEEETNFIISKDIEGSTTCGECGFGGPGIISSEIPLVSYIAVIIMIFVIGKWAFFIAPILFLLLSSQVRTCTQCGNIMESRIQFSFTSVNEKVFTLKMKDLVIVISRRYATIIGSVLLALVVVIFTYEEFFSTNTATDKEPISADRKDFFAWTDYLEDCGSLRIRSNEFRADNLFNAKYKGTKVDWKGYYVGQVAVNRNGIQSVGYMIKMNPSDSKANYDILLKYANEEKEIDQAKEDFTMGAFMSFKGEVLAIGNEEYPMMMGIEAVEESKGDVAEVDWRNLPQYEFKENKKRMFGKGN
jgi:hypothetical protein